MGWKKLQTRQFPGVASSAFCAFLRRTRILFISIFLHLGSIQKILPPASLPQGQLLQGFLRVFLLVFLDLSCMLPHHPFFLHQKRAAWLFFYKLRCSIILSFTIRFITDSLKSVISFLPTSLICSFNSLTTRHHAPFYIEKSTWLADQVLCLSENIYDKNIHTLYHILILSQTYTDIQ